MNIMTYNRERLDAESVAQHSISSSLGPLVTLIGQAVSLYERAARAIADHPRPGAAPKVGLILTARLSNDLLVCEISAQLGYGIQALSLGATVVELVGALSYVGESDQRAEEWARHSNQKRTYPRKVSEGIEAAAATLGMSSQHNMKENWQQAYTFMCTAKHANPRISLLNGLRIGPDGFYHSYGPDASAFGTWMSAEAMYYAIGFGMSGIFVALVHCSDQALQAQLRAEALRVLQARYVLESWLGEWRKAAEHESAHGVV